jgi:hypothetical protein
MACAAVSKTQRLSGIKHRVLVAILSFAEDGFLIVHKPADFTLCIDRQFSCSIVLHTVVGYAYSWQYIIILLCFTSESATKVV